MKEIRYKLNDMSKGRNGFFYTSGVVLTGQKRQDDEVVEITTLTGKGNYSEAILLRIPKSAAAQMGQALIDLSKEEF
jgi:hypothetical protein